MPPFKTALSSSKRIKFIRISINKCHYYSWFTRWPRPMTLRRPIDLIQVWRRYRGCDLLCSSSQLPLSLNFGHSTVIYWSCPANPSPRGQYYLTNWKCKYNRTHHSSLNWDDGSLLQEMAGMRYNGNFLTITELWHILVMLFSGMVWLLLTSMNLLCWCKRDIF